MPPASVRTMRARLLSVQLRRVSYAGAGEARCGMLRTLYSLVFAVSKLRWPHRAIIPDLHLHHQRTPSAHLSKLSIHVSECVTYGLYLWYVTTFHVTFLSVTHHVRTHVYIRTYVLCENRSPIQSLALMRSEMKLVSSL